MPDKSFQLNYPTSQKFVYYLVGSIGAGKSTATGNFRNLTTYDEWIDERKPEAAVPENTLPADTVDSLNEYFVEQFRKKNFAMLEKTDGINVVDRCPLDPLTFGKAVDRPTKARALLEGITDRGKRPVAPGHIIHLDCDLADIKYRCSLKHKYWPESDYQELLDNAEVIYGEIQRTMICTRGRNSNAVAREIAKVIFLEEYRPVNIETELTKVMGSVA
jgi:shikimate kinase